MFAAAFLLDHKYAPVLSLAIVTVGISAALHSYLHPERLELLSRIAATKQIHALIGNNNHEHFNRLQSNPWNRVIALHLLHPLTSGAFLSFSALIIFYESIYAANRHLVPMALGIILSVLPIPHKRMIDVIQQLRIMPVAAPKAAAIIYGLTITPTLLVYIIGLTLVPVTELQKYVFAAVFLCNWSLLLLPMAILQRFYDDESSKAAPFLFWILMFAAALFVAVVISPSQLRTVLAIMLVTTVAVGYRLTHRAFKRMGRDNQRIAPQFKGQR
jgi:hypothetical protein